MRKSLLLTLALSLCALLLPAQEIATIGGIKYYLDAGEATVMKQDASLSGDIVIPDGVTYNEVTYRVTTLTTFAFERCGKITSVVLPESVTSLGDYCFASCVGLTSVQLPSGLTSLGAGCFNTCGLTSITLPAGITSLGDRCFSGCSNLESMTLPSGLTSLGEMCFSHCTNLTSITLPESLTSLGEGCFTVCTSLTAVTLPKGLTSLPGNCFDGCSNLISITLPVGLTSLGNMCFYYCTSLTSMTLPVGLTSLGDYCFSGCTGLTSITLTSGLTSLGDGCFSASSLTSITLPSSLTSLGSTCFGGCFSLLKVTCEWQSLEGLEISTDNTFASVFSECKLYVPRGTTSMYQAAEPWKSSFKNFVEYDLSDEEVAKCEAPSVSFSDGELVFTSATTGAKCFYTLTTPDAKSATTFATDGKVGLACRYDIEAYASAEGCVNSDVTKATLYFIAAAEDDETVIASPVQRGVVLTAMGRTIRVNGLKNGEKVSLYTTTGTLLGSATATAGEATLDASSVVDAIVLVKIGAHSLKVQL